MASSNSDGAEKSALKRASISALALRIDG